jgi:hypothetical protein
VTPITIRSNQSSAVKREAEEDWGPGAGGDDFVARENENSLCLSRRCLDS